ncbi:MAG TPA: GNAT family N-acetyltransferase [Patescibacteria group bacterium]|nr:GNAT family N-acetyltransferase [Patescibacteria group bacterium]
MSGVLLRPARAEEVPLMQALELDAAKSYAQLPGYDFSVGLAARTDAEHQQVRETGAAIVAETSAGVCGFILVLPLDGRGHIFEAAVAAEMQGRGIGRQLVAAAEDYARVKGYAEMTLTTYRDVPWNAPFYARLGYELLEPCPDRPELQALMAGEFCLGYCEQPRVAMRKLLAA